MRSASPAISRPATIRIDRRSAPATAGCWSATPSASSIRSIRRACLLALKSGELAADAIVDGLKKGDTSAAQLGAWGDNFNQGVDRMRRLVCEYYDGFSFGKFVKNYPELRNTVTDLLIGDLFTDKVDKVWKPMESLYPADKQRLLTWKEGVAPDEAQHKANELVLPEGRALEAGSISVSMPTLPPPRRVCRNRCRRAWCTSRCSSATWRKPSTPSGETPALDIFASPSETSSWPRISAQLRLQGAAPVPGRIRSPAPKSPSVTRSTIQWAHVADARRRR